MELREVKQAYELGAIKSFRAERAPLGKGWWLCFLGDKVDQSWWLETAQKQIRVFATLDTLVGIVEQVGFEVDAICLAR